MLTVELSHDNEELVSVARLHKMPIYYRGGSVAVVVYYIIPPKYPESIGICPDCSNPFSWFGIYLKDVCLLGQVVFVVYKFPSPLYIGC